MKLIRRKWTTAEVDLMFEMIADCQRRGVRTEWRLISHAVGHKASNCSVKFEVERARRKDALAASAVTSADATRDEAASPERSNTKGRPDGDYSRSTSTAMLVMDAELRRRIEVLGVTGGLLGDPLPGRSALDRRGLP